MTLYPKSVRCSVTFAFSRALFAKNTKRRIYIWYCFLVAKMTDANKKRLNTIYPMFANFLTRTPPPKKISKQTRINTVLCQCKKKKVHILYNYYNRINWIGLCKQWFFCIELHWFSLVRLQRYNNCHCELISPKKTQKQKWNEVKSILADVVRHFETLFLVYNRTYSNIQNLSMYSSSLWWRMGWGGGERERDSHTFYKLLRGIKLWFLKSSPIKIK